jgi:GWxTD domain-containing protein
MRRLALSLAAALAASFAVGQSVPELFQKAKDEVKAGSWREALATMEAVDLEAGRPANQKFQPQLEAPLAFYRGVCESNLDRVDAAGADFETFLLLQPGASIDQSVYSTKAVAAFERAQAAMAAPKPSLQRAYRQFPPAPPAAMNAPVTADWGKGPVTWLMSDSEKAAWTKLKGDPERVAFVEAFWRAREFGDGHAFRAIFERRVAFADAELGQGDKPGDRGSMTDRGMVLILLGPPAYSKEEDIRKSASISDVSSDSSSRGPASVSTGPGTRSSGSSRSTVPGTGASGLTANGDSRSELWHYRKGLLANGTSYPEVTVQFWFRGGHSEELEHRNEQVNAILSAAKKPA